VYAFAVTHADNTVMVCVDLLGFADLVRAHPQIDDHTFTHVDRLTRQTPYDGFVAQFVNFHQIIENESTQFAAQLLSGAATQVVTFADSVYITMPALKEAAATAARLMRELIGAEVPARIGIGCGTFVALRFQPPSGDAHPAVYSSQFLGTAIVNARDAVLSPAKGLRILLHSSTSPNATDEDLDLPQVLPVPERTGPESAAGSHAVWAEINYSSPADAHVDEALMAAMRRMKEGAGAKASHHYTATFDAFNRMRAARGRSAL
jgi:hypothetical protein